MKINIEIELTDKEVEEYAIANLSGIIDVQKILEKYKQSQHMNSFNFDYNMITALIKQKMNRDLKEILFNPNSFKRDIKISNILND